LHATTIFVYIATEQLLERKVDKLKQLESSERQTSDSLTSMKTVTQSTSKQLERTAAALARAEQVVFLL
jgi:hypothetical protein